MKKIVLTIMVCIAIFTGLPSLAETAYELPNNFTILSEALQMDCIYGLEEYTVTHRNLQENYGPEDFTNSEVQSCEKLDSTYNSIENYVSYVYTNGSRLILPNTVSLIYGNTDREKYEQLILFFNNTNYPDTPNNLSFQTRDDAITFCTNILGKLGIEDLSVDRVIALDVETICNQTETMLSFYRSDKLQYFHNVDISDEAYYIAFRHFWDGVGMIGDPQAEFIINSNGICSLKLYHIVETVCESALVSDIYPIEKALQLFVDQHSQQKSDLDLYTITNVRSVYYPIYDDKLYPPAVRYVPCWYISGTCEYHFGNKVKKVDVSCLYSMKDGTHYIEQ